MRTLSKFSYSATLVLVLVLVVLLVTRPLRRRSRWGYRAYRGRRRR